MQPELYPQMREVEDRHWWFRGRRRIVAAMLDQLELPKNSRLADLGCGTGGNLAMLSAYGNVTGVEMDEAAADLARQRGHAPVMTGSLPDNLPLNEGECDCVVMTDVLEHIEQDGESLVAVNRLLRPGGHLLVTVPAFMFLWGPHDEAHHHYRRYRARELRERLQRTGFEVSKLSYYNTWLFPLVAMVRLVMKILPEGKAGMEAALPSAWINQALYLLFGSERHVLRYLNYPFGVSLLAVARKLPGAQPL